MSKNLPLFALGLCATTDALDCTYGGTYQGTTAYSALEITFHTEPDRTSAAT